FVSNALRSERKSRYVQEPCARCRYHAVCATQEMACVTYARFIGSMHGQLQRYATWPTAPRAEIYAVLFSKEDDDETVED
ncbi:MAG: hypothetical protein WBP44_07160, partial [Gammaproteobacteria bacterium]